MTELVAKFVKQVTVVDPDTGLEVEVCMYKDMSTGGIFGIDGSFIVSEEPETVKSPFADVVLTLVGD